MNDKKFVDGLIVKPPRDTAPDFVKCSISIKTDELIAFLNNEGSEWVNIDVKESKTGKWYAEVNTWKPEKSVHAGDEKLEDDIPF